MHFFPLLVSNDQGPYNVIIIARYLVQYQFILHLEDWCCTRLCLMHYQSSRCNINWYCTRYCAIIIYYYTWWGLAWCCRKRLCLLKIIFIKYETLINILMSYSSLPSFVWTSWFRKILANYKLFGYIVLPCHWHTVDYNYHLGSYKIQEVQE